LEELKAEKKWDKAFAESEHILGQLADEAIEAHRREKTTQKDVENL